MENGGVKYSNFHVTVNTNKPNSYPLIVKFKQAVENGLCRDDTILSWLKQYDGSSRVDFKKRNYSALVERVRIRAAFEIEGKQNRCLHCHILVEVAHKTMVQIDARGVEAFFDKRLGITTNVHCRFIPGVGEGKDFILHYITKEVPSYTPQEIGNRRLKAAFANGDDVQAESYN